VSRAFLKPAAPLAVSPFTALSLSEAMRKVRDAESPEAVAAALEIVAAYLKSGMFAVRPSLAESPNPRAIQLVLELAYVADA
jgi:hypothetical protein